jgi:hypothetical protein
METTETRTDSVSINRTNFEYLRQLILNNFDAETWDATEAMLSAHATLLLQGQSGGIGLVITGPSGSGKTTVLKFLEGLEEMVYRSDDVTPASFVSHDSSKTEEQLKKVDLLPKIKHKTLLSRDMATWFAGDQEAVYKRMWTATGTPVIQGHTASGDTSAAIIDSISLGPRPRYLPERGPLWVLSGIGSSFTKSEGLPILRPSLMM